MSEAPKKSATTRPAPRVTPETAAYWKAAHDGHLMLAECQSCGKLSHPPQAVCALCWKGNIKPRFASGRGRLNSYSVIHQSAAPYFRDNVPYVLAYVDLEEGVSLVSNLVNCDITKLAVGMPVRARFEPLSEQAGAVLFEPA